MRLTSTATLRGRALILILAAAFLLPPLTGWAVDHCCPSAGGRGSGGPASLAAADPEEGGPDASSPEDACACAFCQTVRSVAPVTGLCPPGGVTRLPAPVASIPTSAASSRIFRPPIA